MAGLQILWMGRTPHETASGPLVLSAEYIHIIHHEQNPPLKLHQGVPKKKKKKAVYKYLWWSRGLTKLATIKHADALLVAF